MCEPCGPATKEDLSVGEGSFGMCNVFKLVTVYVHATYEHEPGILCDAGITDSQRVLLFPCYATQWDTFQASNKMHTVFFCLYTNRIRNFQAVASR